MVSYTTQLKLTASDGKKYNTDVISQDGVDKLAYGGLEMSQNYYLRYMGQW